MIQVKRPPQTSSPEMDRVMQWVFDELQKLANAMNDGVVNPSQTTGRVGDIAVEKDGANFSIKIRTAEGWIRSVPSTFEFDSKSP